MRLLPPHKQALPVSQPPATTSAEETADLANQPRMLYQRKLIDMVPRGGSMQVKLKGRGVRVPSLN